MHSLKSLLCRHRRFPSETGAGSKTKDNQDAGPPDAILRNQSPPRVFPSSGFEVIAPSVKLDEETHSWYSVKNFYPAAIGEVLQSRYQIVAKLGYGAASTTWLCRDLRQDRHVTVKIYASGERQSGREIAALKHIDVVLDSDASRKANHIGAASVRRLLDEFQLSRPKSSRTNLCLVFDALGASLADVRKLAFGGRMPIDVVKCVAFYILQALDFVHRQAKLVHADIQEDNIMFAVGDSSEWQAVEEAEMAEPTPRKTYKGHAIYSTRVMELPVPTIPVLCDFGEARFGSESYGEHAMPDLYRAPEILLRIEWDRMIDIWALGLVVSRPRTCSFKLWTLVEGTNLFTNNEGGRWKSARPHMARMISLLGPPPQYILDMTPVTKGFFDKTVVETSLEDELTALEGEGKADFLRFLRRMLHWDQMERATARELLEDPWLTITDDASSEPEEEG
ncbi:kinase-like domain-containing protein [Chaetomium fimeti]|uniref:non-specific serine/threonine protein kinase n=1 Tax=Chaetomium fimeti TaxID=1854472 RepID=A0AAE0HB40_9PEZI|nr:kinase-like domain-containing protein [Chaetomium fimeti]